MHIYVVLINVFSCVCLRMICNVNAMHVLFMFCVGCVCVAHDCVCFCFFFVRTFRMLRMLFML